MSKNDNRPKVIKLCGEEIVINGQMTPEQSIQYARLHRRALHRGEIRMSPNPSSFGQETEN